MNKPLRVLIVEDSDDDASLLLRELRRSGYDPAFERVETAAAMRAALERQAWDIIIADYSLPQFSAPDALALLQASGLDLPFVVVSGSIGEDRAVDALKAGAHDFVIKGRWARLIPAIERELREAEVRRARRRAEEELRAAEAKYRALVEQLPAIVYGLSFGDTTWTSYISPQVESLLGFSPAEWQADPELWIKQLHPDDRERVLAEVRRADAEGRPLNVEYRVLARDGRVRWFHNQSALMLDETGRPRYSSGVMFDVTERMEAETALWESQSRYRALFEDSPISLWEQDFSAVKQKLEAWRRQGVTDFRAFFESQPEAVAECLSAVKIVAVNNMSVRLYGAQSKAELLTDLARLIPPEARSRFGDELIWMAEGRTEFELESVNRTLAGELIDIHLHWVVAPGYENTLARVLVSVIDVTQSKRAEEQIRRNAARAEALARTAARLNAQLKLDDVLNAVCEETARALGVPAVALNLYDERRDHFAHAAGFGLPPDFGPQSRPFPHALYDDYRRRLGALFVIPDVQALSDVPNADLTRLHDIRTLACAGLFRGDQPIGTLNALTFHAPREFNADELALLKGLADQAAQAVSNARLYEEAERRLQHVEALRAIDISIAGSLDLRLSLHVIVEQVIGQLKADAADVLLLNPHTRMLEYAAGRGFRSEAITHTRVRPGEGYAGIAVLERRSIHIPDWREEEPDLRRAPDFSGENFQACFVIPLIAKGNIRGVLEVFHRQPFHPNSEWLDFLDALAGQAGLAIDNATLFNDLQKSNVDLVLAYDATIEGWSRALDLRDKETEGHTQRVTETTLRLGRAMGMSDAELVHVRRGALLHDIGKMGIPDGILLKPGPLTAEEWAIMRRHPVYAYELLAPIPFLRPALDIPYCHHEKWDGTGYPRGLRGELIPLAARVFAVVDVWDALRSDRPYRAGWPEEKVFEYIRAEAGKHFDPQMVEAFLALNS
jgi:PAS domain S-box-containing protein